jgi:hypothetical protein
MVNTAAAVIPAMIHVAKTYFDIVGSVFVLEFAVTFAKSTISTVGGLVPVGNPVGAEVRGLLPVHVTGGGHAPVLRQAGHSAPLVHAVLWVRSHLHNVTTTEHIPAPAPLIELLFNFLP